MSLPDYSAGISQPGQDQGAGSPLAQHIEEFGGKVEETIARRSVMDGWLPVRSVRGTSTVRNFAVGESTIQAVTPGVTPPPTEVRTGDNSVTIDTLILARSAVPLLDDFQNSFGARAKIGVEHGKKLAKFRDQSFLIQGFKAATAAVSSYGAGLPGYSGGSTVPMVAAGDLSDPAKMYDYIGSLLEEMEGKDVDPQDDDLCLFVRPDVFYTLLRSEYVINGEYITSEGNSMKGPVFSSWGIPVKKTNNLLREAVTGHELSNAGNGNAYDVDMSRCAALIMSPRAVLAGENIAVTSDVFYDRTSKLWFIDAHCAFAATADRNEYAGALLLPAVGP